MFSPYIYHPCHLATAASINEPNVTFQLALSAHARQGTSEINIARARGHFVEMKAMFFRA